MVKILNILFIVIIALSCTKDKVAPSPFIDEDLSFLLGTWKWEYSAIERSGFVDFVKANEVTKFCKITFLVDGKLRIVSNNADVEYNIRTHSVFQDGEDTFFRFLMDGDKMLTFSYTKESGLLNSSFVFFTFDPLTCNNFPIILDNGFKKL